MTVQRIVKKKGLSGNSHDLTEDIYNCPRPLSVNQRLDRRSLQLFRLARALEYSIKSGDSAEVLAFYPRALECIGVDIKLIADRLEMQRRSRRK